MVLQGEITLLRTEVAQLKSLLLAHKDCPVTIAQQRNNQMLSKYAAVIRLTFKTNTACQTQSKSINAETNCLRLFGRPNSMA